jgi:mRNA-degrading endonuclease RelE of RelBE toxin-antitoxin system
MKSKATPGFWRQYNRLPHKEQRRARKAYQTWRANPSTPGLRFKRVSEEEPIYSARVSDDYRVLGLLEGDTVVWFWIGAHDEYERILKQYQ